MTKTRTELGLAVLATLLALVAHGCGEPPPAEDVSPRTYQARGVIRQMPTEESLAPEIWIRHEAIAEFVDIEGRTVGMDSMTMPFRLEPGLGLTGLEAGDKVAFELTVDWEAKVPARITGIEKLAPETELSF